MSPDAGAMLMAMAFSPGDGVHVAGLGKGVVREVRRGGRCLVEIKGRSLVVDASQLTAIEPERRRSKTPSAQVTHEHQPSGPAPASIDLHGLAPDDALAALDTFINDALLAGHASVQVIHGRGAGRLRAAVHQRLARIAAVRHIRIDPANPGVTIVTL
jgi:DNA mismatch repair protein MutS2